MWNPFKRKTNRKPNQHKRVPFAICSNISVRGDMVYSELDRKEVIDLLHALEDKIDHIEYRLTQMLNNSSNNEGKADG